MAGLCAGVVAPFAGKRLLASVGEPVFLKITSHCTLVIALIAAVGLLSNVGEHMPLEVISKCARITAMFTCKTFSPV